MVGQLLDGRYQVIDVIESTDFGKTYLARDTRRPGESLCFVKHLHLTPADAKLVNVARQRFQQEAKVLEKLSQHDQIPQLLAYFEENREFYLVESYVAGHSLMDEILPGKPLTENQVINLLTDVLGILRFVHQQGVIHRDIKPSNLIRRQTDGKIILLDFGAVQEINLNSDQDSPSSRVGTLEYMPIEQFQCHPHFNSDIYALGMVAIQSLTGLPASELSKLRRNNGSDTGEIFWRHLAIVSVELGDIVDKMVRSDYHQRYQSVDDVLSVLKTLRSSSAPNLSKLEIYREEVQRCANHHRGEISIIGRQILEELRLSLDLLPEDAEAVEDEILNPYRKYNEKGERYEQALIATIKQEYPFSPETREELKRFQQLLGLNDQDIAVIEKQVLPQSILTQFAQFIQNFRPIPSLAKSQNIESKFLKKTRLSQLLWLGLGLVSLLGIILAISEYQKWRNLQQFQTQKINAIQGLLVAGKYEQCLNEADNIPETALKNQAIENLIQQCRDKVFWKTVTPKEFAQNADAIWAVTFSPDGQTIASGSQDTTLKLWDIKSRNETKSLVGDFSPIYAVDFNSDGTEISSGSGLWRILEWNLTTGKVYPPLEHLATIWSVDVSPDNQAIASASADKTVKIWDRQTGAILQNLTDHQDQVYAVVFSPDGQLLVTASLDKTIKIWKVETGELLNTLTGHLDGVRSLAISSDGKIIVSGSLDDTVKVWNLETGALIHTLTGHSNDVLSVAISPDSHIIASSSRDKTIKLWNLKTGELLNTLTGHQDEIYSIKFSPDGNSLVSGSKDKTIKLWLR
ncbi:MAG: protein kinase domain-containing protein [Planktothrix agardhii]|jgi:serine/threonine protein kinase